MQTDWLTDDLWPRLEECFRNSETRKAAIAYVSNDSQLRFNAGDQLVVNASDAAIQSGATCAKLLKAAWERGAELFCCESLHAKTILFDKSWAYAGSANLSSNSRSNLNELGVISNAPEAVVRIERFIQQLIDQSQPIGEEFISRILDLEVRPTSGRKGKRKSTPEMGKQFWLIGILDLEPPDQDLIENLSQESTHSDKEWDCFWLLPKHQKLDCYIEAREGDEVILIDRSKSQKEHTCWHATICEVIPLGSGDRIYRYCYDPRKNTGWKQVREICKEEGVSPIAPERFEKLDATQFESIMARWPTPTQVS